jgi:maltose O-acetyltransferase
MNLYFFRRVIGARGRIHAWRKLGVTIADPVSISPGVWIPHRPQNVTIGSGTRLGGSVKILSWNKVTIGRNVITNDEIYLLAGGHDPDSATFGGKGAPITIGDYAWLPVRITVLAGVAIGSAAVIGSGSVVVQDVPDHGIAVGNPARVVKYRADISFAYEPVPKQ